MIEITSIFKTYPVAFLVLIFVLLVVVFVLVYRLTKNNNKQAPLPSVELHLFELTAKQLIAFQSLIGEMIYRHKTVIADSLEDTSKTFLEDINAAVELNNQKKEQQLKDTLLNLLTNKRQIVATDILNLNLATKQLEMLSSKEMTLCVIAIKDKVGAMLEHTQSYMSHLEDLAKSPFDSRLQTQLALSTEDQDTLLQLIDTLNNQFKREKLQLLSAS